MLSRAGAALLTLVSAVALSQDAPPPKTVTTDKLVMTGRGGDAPASKPFEPKAVITEKLTMTGLGGDAPASKPFEPKTVTTEKLTMTGAGK
jgi:hypothetical protein